MKQEAHMNQLWNCKNHNQGEEKRILTICSAGLLRSPTTAQLLEKEYGFNCRAAGIVEEYALIPVTEVLIHWADEIVFMEEEHMLAFISIWGNSAVAATKIKHGAFQVLNIPDNYRRNDEALKKLILAAYNENLNSTWAG